MSQRAEFELSVNVDIRQKNAGFNGLQIRETATLNAETFLELAEILSQFHKLTKKISEGMPL